MKNKKIISIVGLAFLSIPIFVFASNVNWIDIGANTYTLGKVGIGTNSPSIKLSVGSSSVGLDTYMAGYRFDSGFQNSIKILSSGTGAVLGLQNASYTGFSGIDILSGTGDTLSSLGQNVDTGNFIINSKQDTASISFDIINNTKMYIANNGNVGIGTNSPSEKLSVNGLGYFSSGIKFSDGTIQTTAGGSGTSTPVVLPQNCAVIGSDNNGNAICTAQTIQDFFLNYYASTTIATSSDVFISPIISAGDILVSSLLVIFIILIVTNYIANSLWPIEIWTNRKRKQ